MPADWRPDEAGRRQREAMLPAWPPSCHSRTYLGFTSRNISPTAGWPRSIAPAPTCRRRSSPRSSAIWKRCRCRRAPIVPYVECVHDRIAVEIMRGCPWQCRFCQSTVIKRPLRIREVETIVAAALEAHRNTGFNEISLLSLSTSDYPYFEQLMRRMQEVFRPLGVNISVPSLRVNEILKSVAALGRHGSPLGADAGPGSCPRRHARADSQEDQERRFVRRLPAAFADGFDKVKLYFMCGLPGERQVDLDGIVEMVGNDRPRSAARCAGGFRR